MNDPFPHSAYILLYQKIVAEYSFVRFEMRNGGNEILVDIPVLSVTVNPRPPSPLHHHSQKILTLNNPGVKC